MQRLPRPKKADVAAARRDMKRARFLAHESVDVAVAVLLRRQGFNVVPTSEAGRWLGLRREGGRLASARLQGRRARAPRQPQRLRPHSALCWHRGGGREARRRRPWCSMARLRSTTSSYAHASTGCESQTRTRSSLPESSHRSTRAAVIESHSVKGGFTYLL